MGLNDIKLPEFVIGEWYGENLPAASLPATSMSPARPTAANSNYGEFAAISPDPSPKYLGSNRRHISVLVNSPGIPFLPDNQLAFLTKILEACHMTIADVAIVNNATTPTSITAIKEQLQPKTLLLFGVDPTAILLPINFPLFRQMDYDACTYLSAPGLDQLAPNTDESKLLKSKLWVCLKTIFNV